MVFLDLLYMCSVQHRVFPVVLKTSICPIVQHRNCWHPVSLMYPHFQDKMSLKIIPQIIQPIRFDYCG